MQTTDCEKKGAERINPYDNSRHKGAQVEEMFDSIAPAYDFMNTAMTFGLHRFWRNKALKAAVEVTPHAHDILDVATGTGDVAFRVHRMLPEARITGIDLSQGMLDVARDKLKSLPESEQSLIAFGKGDCLDLPFHDGSFDLITVAYGVRNFENLLQGLREMRRVLRKGGCLCVIELSCPQGALTGLGYRIYSRRLIPVVGKMVSGDSRAYTYLPESIAAAPQRDDMATLMRQAGFRHVKWKELTFGAVTYYLAQL